MVLDQPNGEDDPLNRLGLSSNDPNLSTSSLSSHDKESSQVMKKSVGSFGLSKSIGFQNTRNAAKRPVGDLSEPLALVPTSTSSPKTTDDPFVLIHSQQTKNNVDSRHLAPQAKSQTMTHSMNKMAMNKVDEAMDDEEDDMFKEFDVDLEEDLPPIPDFPTKPHRTASESESESGPEALVDLNRGIMTKRTVKPDPDSFGGFHVQLPSMIQIKVDVSEAEEMSDGGMIAKGPSSNRSNGRMNSSLVPETSAAQVNGARNNGESPETTRSIDSQTLDAAECSTVDAEGDALNAHKTARDEGAVRSIFDGMGGDADDASIVAFLQSVREKEQSSKAVERGSESGKDVAEEHGSTPSREAVEMSRVALKNNSSSSTQNLSLNNNNNNNSNAGSEMGDSRSTVESNEVDCTKDGNNPFFAKNQDSTTVPLPSSPDSESNPPTRPSFGSDFGFIPLALTPPLSDSPVSSPPPDLDPDPDFCFSSGDGPAPDASIEPGELDPTMRGKTDPENNNRSHRRNDARDERGEKRSRQGEEREERDETDEKGNEKNKKDEKNEKNETDKDKNAPMFGNEAKASNPPGASRPATNRQPLLRVTSPMAATTGTVGGASRSFSASRLRDRLPLPTLPLISSPSEWNPVVLLPPLANTLRLSRPQKDVNALALTQRTASLVSASKDADSRTESASAVLCTDDDSSTERPQAASVSERNRTQASSSEGPAGRVDADLAKTSTIPVLIPIPPSVVQTPEVEPARSPLHRVADGNAVPLLSRPNASIPPVSTSLATPFSARGSADLPSSWSTSSSTAPTVKEGGGGGGGGNALDPADEHVVARMDSSGEGTEKGGKTTTPIDFLTQTQALESMLLDANQMRMDLMELRVQTALGSTRLVRLDSTILRSRVTEIRRRADRLIHGEEIPDGIRQCDSATHTSSMAIVPNLSGQGKGEEEMPYHPSLSGFTEAKGDSNKNNGVDELRIKDTN